MTPAGSLEKDVLRGIFYRLRTSFDNERIPESIACQRPSESGHMQRLVADWCVLLFRAESVSGGNVGEPSQWDDDRGTQYALPWRIVWWLYAAAPGSEERRDVLQTLAALKALRARQVLELVYNEYAPNHEAHRARYRAARAVGNPQET